MFANRISYWLNAKGPSMAIDEACCSSTCALEQAYLAITRGECDAAIVGAGSLCLHPQSSVHYGRIMKLSMDGKTKSFDSNPAGCSKSESVNVLFLQKAKDALRVYAEVAYIKCEFTQLEEDESGPKYGFYRNPTISADFIKKFYQEADVSPDVVEYVEAVGSAVAEADKSELQAIDEVFCKNRSDPLKVGSVMSNIGYTEAASGICAITKVLLAYHTGKIAANLHCDSPRQDVAALRDGRICIVTDHMDFNYSYTAVNGLSVTGVNSHILLKGHYKQKETMLNSDNCEQLVEKEVLATSMAESRTVEKRQRQNSDDTENENEEFITTRSYRDVLITTKQMQSIEEHEDMSNDVEEMNDDDTEVQNVNTDDTNYLHTEKSASSKELNNNQDVEKDNLNKFKDLYRKLKEIIISKRDFKEKICDAFYLVIEEICISFPSLRKVGEVIKKMSSFFDG
ncbi:unnamed protein product, partial [Brenthis ino]